MLKTEEKLIMFQECSKYILGIYKKTGPEPVNFVVDQNDYPWNTFLEYVFIWYPVLKEIYKEIDNINQVP
jgi:hypothetical protein